MNPTAARAVGTPGPLLALADRWSTAELVSHAADLLSDSAGLLHDNEPRWRRINRRVEALAAPPAE
jgi:hypothetical protein